VNQRHAQLILELLSQTRLCDSRFLGSATEMQFFRDGDKISKVTQFRKITIKYISVVANKILDVLPKNVDNCRETIRIRKER